MFGEENIMITSRSNAKIRSLITLKKKSSERNEKGLFLVEGIKMFREIPQDLLVEVYASESFLKTDQGRTAVESFCMGYDAEQGSGTGRKKSERSSKMGCGGSGPVLELVSDQIFQDLSDTQSPQGILALVRQQTYRFEDLLGQGGSGAHPSGKQPLVLVLENIRDPGNLGTMIRTAEGAGATGILLSRGTADLYNPKVTRSTMGSIFRMPFLYTDDLAGDIAKLKASGVTVCAAHLQGRHTYDGENYRGGCAFLIGNESRGLSDQIADLADLRVRIPMVGKVESLNAAVAAAILLYEAGRQRRK